MAATRDRGRNQPPAMKLGGMIPAEWQEKIDKAARMVATMLWHAGGEPPVDARGEIRSGVIAAAREAVSDAPSGDMFEPPAAFGARPGRLGFGEPVMSTPGVFRVVIGNFDWSNPTVAESIMVIIERATDAELARPIPGSL